jgi:archaellum component FlaF (FlaF/FlaG flagellin family)
MRKKLVKCLLFLMLTLVVLNINTPPSKAGPTTIKILDPIEGDTSLTYTKTNPPPTAPGYPLGYVLINVSVFNVVDLTTWQINITWDPTLLKIARVDPSGDPTKSDIFLPPGNIFGEYADPVGLTVTGSSAFWVVSIKLGAPFETFSGSGTLCQIKFNVTKTPTEGENLTTAIHFVVAGEHAFYTKLIDVEGDLISYTPQDGYYEYSWPPPPPPPSEGAAFYIRPEEIINSSIIPPQTVSFNVTIKDVTDMYGYSFKLKYDPSILLCINLKIYDVLGETNYIPEFSVDNSKGIVFVNVTYIPPAQPITSELELALVEIQYRVRGIGATLLNLQNTTLTDSLGRPIPHAVHHGLFANILRDLAIISVTPYSSWVYQGNSLKINITIKNQGEVTESSITVKAYYDGIMFENQTIVSINPNEEITLTFAWNTKNIMPCQNYTISAEVTIVPYEINVSNNIYIDGKVKVRLYGDVNGDSIIDGQDLQIVKRSIPSSPGDPRWNPEADVNGDGLIDGIDLQKIKKNLGKSC